MSSRLYTERAVQVLKANLRCALVTRSQIAVGTSEGIIHILTTADGALAAQLPVTQTNICCMAFSRGGDVLAAGASDGVMYLLPASDNGFSYEKVSVLKV